MDRAQVFCHEETKRKLWRVYASPWEFLTHWFSSTQALWISWYNQNLVLCHVSNMAVYLDILSPIHRTSLAMQQEIHDPVKVIKQIKEFMWTMAKLVILSVEAMENANILTNFRKFWKVTVNEEGKHLYQNVHLKLYNCTFNAIKTHYKEIVLRICSRVKKCFAGIQESPIFKNIEVLLDTKSWPIDKDSSNFGDNAVKEISSHFQELLSKNNCEVGNMP